MPLSSQGWEDSICQVYTWAECLNAVILQNSCSGMTSKILEVLRKPLLVQYGLSWQYIIVFSPLAQQVLREKTQS